MRNALRSAAMGGACPCTAVECAAHRAQCAMCMAWKLREQAETAERCVGSDAVSPSVSRRRQGLAPQWAGGLALLGGAPAGGPAQIGSMRSRSVPSEAMCWRRRSDSRRRSRRFIC